ncbi:MAG TPA: hypothetical protein ENK60_06390 [Anaerolineae bacterium]|nr:hypothetical protein [Anaerolineae bacterium]
MSSCQITTAQQEMARGLTFRFDKPEMEVERIAVYPYPDLTRLWVRVQLTSFATPVNIEMTCFDPEGQVVADMLLVEWREPYISLTMHLKKPPQPDAEYTLQVQVERAGKPLAVGEHIFPLTFIDPNQE